MTNIDLGLAGKVVLVTGGVRGVGAGISTVFREAGAVVVTCARRRADEGSDVADLEFYSVDLRDAEAVRAMIDGIVADHGRLDVVVNNAGAHRSPWRRRPAPTSTPRSSLSTCCRP